MKDDADIESCVPVKGAPEADGFTVHTLPGGRCVSLVHKGPYEDLHAPWFDQGYSAIDSHIFVDDEGGRAIYMAPGATSETTSGVASACSGLTSSSTRASSSSASDHTKEPD